MWCQILAFFCRVQRRGVSRWAAQNYVVSEWVKVNIWSKVAGATSNRGRATATPTQRFYETEWVSESLSSSLILSLRLLLLLDDLSSIFAFCLLCVDLFISLSFFPSSFQVNNFSSSQQKRMNKTRSSAKNLFFAQRTKLSENVSRKIQSYTMQGYERIILVLIIDLLLFFWVTIWNWLLL